MLAWIRWQMLWLLVFAAQAVAAGYRSFELAADQATLTITTTDGKTFEAPRLPEQVDYDTPRISADGRHVGWLARFPNCCTSYPIALKLVVLDPAGQQHTFSGQELALFDWQFMPGAPASVAFRQGVLHGTDAQHFEWRRVSDGRLLGQYDYPHGELANERARRRAPAWVRRVPD